MSMSKKQIGERARVLYSDSRYYVDAAWRAIGKKDCKTALDNLLLAEKARSSANAYTMFADYPEHDYAATARDLQKIVKVEKLFSDRCVVGKRRKKASR